MGHSGRHLAEVKAAETLSQFIAGMSDIPSHSVRKLSPLHVERLADAAEAASHFTLAQLEAHPQALPALDRIITHRSSLLSERAVSREVLDGLSLIVTEHDVRSADPVKLAEGVASDVHAQRRLAHLASQIVSLPPTIQADIPTVPAVARLAVQHMRQLTAPKHKHVSAHTAAAITTLVDRLTVTEAAAQKLSKRLAKKDVALLTQAGHAAARLSSNALADIPGAHELLGRVLEAAPQLALSPSALRQLRLEYNLQDLRAVNPSEGVVTDFDKLARGAKAFAALAADEATARDLYWAMPRVTAIATHASVLRTRGLIDDETAQRLIQVPLEQAKVFSRGPEKVAPASDDAEETAIVEVRRGKKHVTSPQERAERIVRWLEPLKDANLLPASGTPLLKEAYHTLVDIGNHRRFLHGALPLTTQQRLAVAAKAFAELAQLPSEAQGLASRMAPVRVMAARLDEMAPGLVPESVQRVMFGVPVSLAFAESKREKPDQARMISLLSPLEDSTHLPPPARAALADAYRLTGRYQLAMDQYDVLKPQRDKLPVATLLGAAETLLMMGRPQDVSFWLGDAPKSVPAKRLAAVAALAVSLKSAHPKSWEEPLNVIHAQVALGADGQLVADFSAAPVEGRLSELPIGRADRPQLVMPLVHALAKAGHTKDAARLIEGLDKRVKYGKFDAADQVEYSIARREFSAIYGAAAGVMTDAPPMDPRNPRRILREDRRAQSQDKSPVLSYFLHRKEGNQPLQGLQALGELVEQYPDDRALARELAKLLRLKKNPLESAAVLFGRDYVHPLYSPEDIDKDMLRNIRLGDFLKIGADLRQGKRPDSAAVLLGALVERFPESEDARLSLGHALRDMKKYDQAIDAYAPLLDSQSHGIAAHAAVAESLLLTNNAKEAMKLLNRRHPKPIGEPLGRLLATAKLSYGLRSDNLELIVDGLQALPPSIVSVDESLAPGHAKNMLHVNVDGIMLDYSKGGQTISPEYCTTFKLCAATFSNITRLGEGLIASGRPDEAYTLFKRLDWMGKIVVDEAETPKTERKSSFVGSVFDSLNIADPGSQETRSDIVRGFLVGGLACVHQAEKFEDMARETQQERYTEMAAQIWRMSFRYILTAYKMEDNNPEVNRHLRLAISRTGDNDMAHAIALLQENHRKDREEAAERKLAESGLEAPVAKLENPDTSMHNLPERRPTRPAVGSRSTNGLR